MNNELYFLIIVIEVIILLILLYTYFNKKKIKEHHADHSESANPGIKFYDRHCGIYPVVKREKQPPVCKDGNLVTDGDRCNQPGIYRGVGENKVIINGDSGNSYEVSLVGNSKADDIRAFLANDQSTCAPPLLMLLTALNITKTGTPKIYTDVMNSWNVKGHYIHTITLSSGLDKNVAAGTKVTQGGSAIIYGTVVSRTDAASTTIVIKQDITNEAVDAVVAATALNDGVATLDSDGILRFNATDHNIEFSVSYPGTIDLTYEDGSDATGIGYSNLIKVKSQAAQFWEQQFSALGDKLITDTTFSQTATLPGSTAQQAFYQVGGMTATKGTQNGSIVGSLVANGSSCKQMGQFKPAEEEALELGERCGDYQGNEYNGCDPKRYRSEDGGDVSDRKVGEFGNRFSFVDEKDPAVSAAEITRQKQAGAQSGNQESDKAKLIAIARNTAWGKTDDIKMMGEGHNNKVSEAAGVDGRFSLPNKGKVRASLDSNYKVIARDCIPAAEPGVIIHEHFSSPFDNVYSSVASFGNKINNILGLNTTERFTEHLISSKLSDSSNPASITNYIGSRDITCRDTKGNEPTAEELGDMTRLPWLKQHMRMRNMADCTVKANGGPLQYKVEKLIEISANSGFFTITIRLHSDKKLKWKMGHDVLNASLTPQQRKFSVPTVPATTAAQSSQLSTDFKSDLFYREFKHVINYSKVQIYDPVGYNGGYDFAKAIKKAPAGQLGGGNSDPADKQAYDNFKWTFGQKGRSSKPHIDITTCPIPWNATPGQIVQAISKVWKNFAANNFQNIRDGDPVSDTQIKQQYMTLNNVVLKPKLAIHIQDVHQAKIADDGGENIYNYTDDYAADAPGNHLLIDYEVGKQTKNISSKIRWNNTKNAGPDSTRQGLWELTTTTASQCPTRRDYNSNTNKSRRQGTALVTNITNTEASKKISETINCIPYNTSEDKAKFVPRRIRIGFIDTGNFTPSNDNLHVLVNSVPKTQLEAYQRQIVLDPTKLTQVAGKYSHAGDIETDVTGKPTANAYKAFLNTANSLSSAKNTVTNAQSNSNDLNGGSFDYFSENTININNIANWDNDKILSIGLGDFEDPDKGVGNVYLVQRSDDKRENCHSGYGLSTDDFYGQNDQVYGDSCLQSRSYITNFATTDYNSSQWDSHGRFNLANNDIGQHLRDRHNINIIENPQDQTLVFFVFYKEDDINKDYSYNNVEALKLATYWEKLTKTQVKAKEISMKLNYVTRLFNDVKTLSIKENKLYQTLVMINNYLSSSYRLTRSSRQLNGKVSNLLRDMSNFVRKHSGNHNVGVTTTTATQSPTEKLRIIMSNPPSSIDYSNQIGTPIQKLSNPYRDSLNFYSKDVGKTQYTGSVSNYTFGSGDSIDADMTKLYKQVTHTKSVTGGPTTNDIFFNFNSLIDFLASTPDEIQDNTFVAANTGNRVWGITQSTVTDLDKLPKPVIITQTELNLLNTAALGTTAPGTTALGTTAPGTTAPGTTVAEPFTGNTVIESFNVTSTAPGTTAPGTTAPKGAGYSSRDARARPAAWSKDFNICNEELSTSKFAEEMNYRATLTNIAVTPAGSKIVPIGSNFQLDTHPDFIGAKDIQYLDNTFQTESSLQVMTGKYPAKVAAWGGRGTGATIDTTANSETYGRAIGGNIVSIIASKFISASVGSENTSGNQVKDVVGGVQLIIGSVALGEKKVEGLSSKIEENDEITVGSSVGTVTKVVPAGEQSYGIILTIGGDPVTGAPEQGSNISSNANSGDLVYQLNNNIIVAIGTLVNNVNSTDVTNTLSVTLISGTFEVPEQIGYPDLRIVTPVGQTTAEAAQTAAGAIGAGFTEPGSDVATVIKTNNIQDSAGEAATVTDNNTARKKLKLLSTVPSQSSVGTATITVTLTSVIPFPTPPATAPVNAADIANFKEFTITRNGNIISNLKTVSQLTPRLLGIGGGSLGGTLSAAVNLYVTEF